MSGWATPPLTGAAAQSQLPVYLIVSPEGFADELVDFIRMQETRGFEVRAVWLTQPVTSAPAVKSEIQAQNPRPRYVVLVGDKELIPNWPTVLPDNETTSTDLYFSTFDGPGDTIPDTILGRIPVQNESQLTAYLDKLLNYYRISGYPDWMKQISFVATNAPGAIAISEGNIERIMTTYTAPWGYEGSFAGGGGTTASTAGGDRLFPSTYHATGEDVQAALMDGRAALMYNGVATNNAFEWHAGPWLTAAQAQNLSIPTVPLVGAFSPRTASYTESLSMADAWLLNETSGALTYIGATADTYQQMDLLMLEGMIQGIFSNAAQPMSVGQAFQAGIAYVSTAQYRKLYYEIYQIFGDPSLVIRYPDGALLTAPFSYFVAPWGGNVRLPVTVKNVGLSEATFDILVSSNQSYPLDVTPNPFDLTLAPGAAVTFPVDIRILTDLDPGTTDTLTITAVQKPELVIRSTLTVDFQVFKPSIFFPLIYR